MSRFQLYRLKLYQIFDLRMEDWMPSSDGRRIFHDVLMILSLTTVMSPNNIESVL